MCSGTTGLSEQSKLLPTLETIKNRENNVFVLLNDINVLQKISITGINFNTLNFQSIRSHKNNISAVYDFFLQRNVPRLY